MWCWPTWARNTSLRTTLRRGASGDNIVAWGERILQWPLDRPELQEVVVPRQGLEYSNGGCALDVNGDGVEELVVSRGKGRARSDPELLWFQMRPGLKTWVEHPIARLGEKITDPHDIQPISARRPTGQVLRGVIVLIDRRQLEWFQIPSDPNGPWERRTIAKLPGSQQSGLAIGDIGGKGRADIVCGMFWVECPADPAREPWAIHQFGDWNDGGWGGMAKHAIADMDGDGRPEIVASEAEIPDSRLGIFRRDPEKPDGLWRCQPIEKGLYCPHSLVVADLDRDRRLDIIVGEMTAGGWDFPLNPKPKIFAYMNRGGYRFDRRTLSEGWGVHEMGIVPPKAAGKVLIFAADENQPHKFPDMKTHVSYWLIDRVPEHRESGP